MTLRAKVLSINNDRVMISLNDGQSLTLSASDIEGTVKVGSEVALVVATLESEDAGRERLAKDLLNELLKT